MILMIHDGHTVDYSAVHRVCASNVSILRGECVVIAGTTGKIRTPCHRIDDRVAGIGVFPEDGTDQRLLMRPRMLCCYRYDVGRVTFFRYRVSILL